ncbi:MAG: hypothetical protein ABSG91_12440 [Syntrophobacteraceae bacterium]|jgi:hypothetical protein
MPDESRSRGRRYHADKALAELEGAFNEGDYPAKMHFEKKIELTEQIASLQLECNEAERQRAKIRQLRNEIENFHQFSAKYKMALLYLTDKIRNAPFALKQKLLKGSFDGRAVVPEDHDLSKMVIPWRYNLPVLKEVLA